MFGFGGSMYRKNPRPGDKVHKTTDSLVDSVMNQLSENKRYRVERHRDEPNTHLYQIIDTRHGACCGNGIVAIGRTHEQALSEAARLNAEERKRDAAEQMHIALNWIKDARPNYTNPEAYVRWVRETCVAALRLADGE